MSLGTLSEKRTKPTTTTTTTAAPTASPPPTEKGEGVKILEKFVESIKKEPTPKEPTLVVDAPKTPTKDPKEGKKCMYCGADKILSLALRGGFVLVLLALCFNLIKTAK